MHQGKDGVGKKHFRTACTHNVPNALAMLGAVTVDAALPTGGFLFLKGAVIQTFARISKQSGAFTAQCSLALMMVAAIPLNHGLYRLRFTFEPTRGKRMGHVYHLGSDLGVFFPGHTTKWLRHKGIIGPGMFGIASFEFFFNLRIAIFPETCQVFRHLNGAPGWREQV